MEDDIRANYFAIIPAYIRYNKELKFGERLMYGEITALSNKEGYCYAKNKYFADLYNVSQSTISRWISHLAELNSIDVQIIRNDKKEIIERRIYIKDTPYMQNCIYPYTQNNQYPIRKKSKDNNINNNKIDRLFYYILDEEKEIPEEFINVEYNEIIVALKRYDMLYSKESMQYISAENLDRIKNITYIIALMVKNKLFYLSNKVSRDKLIQVYNDCKNRENQYKGTDNQIENFINYYYKSIENELTKDVTSPSFFMPDNSEIEI